MSAKEKAKGKAAKVQSEAAMSVDKEPVLDEGTDVEAYEPASARNMPRPQSSLGPRLKKDIGKLTVSLLGDVGTAPTLAEVEKFNKKGEGESRTPLMTVVQAILAKAGGSMQLGDLATQTRKYWNRPFPTSPYTEEELIYLMLRSSDGVRVG
jgi:hypothetical protein